MKKVVKKVLKTVSPKSIISNSDYFDKEWYAKTYNVKLNLAVSHYLENGSKLSYNPSKQFIGASYHKANPDIGGMNPLLHYEVYGMYEGRDLMVKLKPSTYSFNQSHKYCLLNKKDINLNLFFSILELEGAKVYSKPSEINDSDKYVLVMSHEMDLTGAPIALFNTVLYLKNNGYCPVVISPNNGFLTSKYISKDIPVIIYRDLFGNDLLDNFYHLFHFIFINTLTFAKFISRLNGTNNKVIWWLHESKTCYEGLSEQIKDLPDNLCDNILIYAGGDYAKERMHEYRPRYKVNELFYFLPDNSSDKINNQYEFGFEDSTKIIFAMIGTLETRKGYDILLDSLDKISDKIKDKIKIILVGKKVNSNIFNSIKNYKGDVEIEYIEKIDRDLIPTFYSKIDCLICASTDDPMPIVVTEAWKYSVPVICSESTGSANLIEKYGGGLVYKHNDSLELAKLINKFILELDKNSFSVEKGSYIYKNFFTEEAFDNQFKKISFSQDKQCDSLVSVIVPTFNPGEDIKVVIKKIKAQQKVKIEIIIIDSGSQDGTIQYIKEENVKLIQISQKEFSHSYARNLGAENAQGEYLLFMTQDASPSSNHFVYDLLQPLLKNEAVATMNRQIPRDDSDLYGAMSVYFNNEYFGMNKQDSISSLPNDVSNKEIMRKNGQLDDVCCLIKKNVFDQYKYRGVYAEDLDLGIRLIQDGYTLARLSSVAVIHSHNRKPFYFLKRAIIESRMYLQNSNFDDLDSRINSCITLYVLTLRLKTKLKNIFNLSYDLESLFTHIQEEINTIIVELDNTYISDDWINDESYDENVHSLMVLLRKNLKCDVVGNAMFFENYKFVVCKQFYQYLLENNIAIRIVSADDYYAFINKAFANLVGSSLTDYLGSNTVSNNIQELLETVRI